MKTLGVVLCGGKSSRMGTDKGLILKENCTWSERAFLKLSLLSVPVVISVNVQQQEFYEKIFSEDVLITDALSIGGPLNGILSVHCNNPDHDLLVLACDLVEISSVLIQELYDAYVLHPHYDFFVYRNKGYYEPLCGIYTAKSLVVLLKEVQAGRMERFSMKSILEKGKTCVIDIQEHQCENFLNFNEPAMLTGRQAG